MDLTTVVEWKLRLIYVELYRISGDVVLVMSNSPLHFVIVSYVTCTPVCSLFERFHVVVY